MKRVLRATAWAGLFLLGLVVLWGLAYSIRKGDLKGFASMGLMAGLLAFCAYVLGRGAKLEARPGPERLVGGWAGEPLSAFLLGVVLKTIEGRIYVVGALASLLVAVLSLTLPRWAGVSPDRVAVHAVLFGSWPVLAFLFYVKVCGPSFRSSPRTTILTLLVVGFPFYVAYT